MPPSTINIVEVSARDGLQNEAHVITTDDKVALITRMIAAGARRLEVASFVNPRRVPQMADAEAVIAALPDRKDTSFIGLCLNQRGVVRALATREHGRRGIDEIGSVVVASDSFGIRNQGQTVAQGIAETIAMVKLAKQEGLIAQVTIAASFGCPFEGDVPPQRVYDIAQRLIEAAPDEISLADTIGVGVPQQVSEVFGRVREILPPAIRLRAHFHNTRNTGIANAWAAIMAGVTQLDASVAGLGGCPFAPKASGNIATEDLIYMCKRSGIATGYDIEATIATAHWTETLTGKPAASMVGRAGDFIATNTNTAASA